MDNFQAMERDAMKRRRLPYEMDRFNQYVEALQKWRDEDHEDATALHRNQVIVILEGIYALREATNELLATHPAAFRKPGKIDNRTDNAVRIARLALNRSA